MFGLSRLRTAARIIVSRNNLSSAITPLRTSSGANGWMYREPSLNKPKSHLIAAEGIMALMWYWIMFHMWYDWKHLVGHDPYPDPSQWTDEELGIPPLEEN